VKEKKFTLQSSSKGKVSLIQVVKSVVVNSAAEKSEMSALRQLRKWLFKLSFL
jgi:hypothetical protein